MTPRKITTVSERDALPAGSVVRTARGAVATRHECARGWLIAGLFGPQTLYPDTDLPAVVLHDPSAPVVPVVSDAAVKAVADALKAHYGPLGDPDEGTLCDCGAAVAPVGEYGVRAWREHVAGAALDAVLPHLGAAPSATRENVEGAIYDVDAASGEAVLEPSEIAWLADGLLARFTITPRTDR